MIIWQGRGGLVVLIVFLTSLIGNVITNYISSGYYDKHTWVAGIFVAISALFIHILYKNTDMRERSLVDQDTGDRLVYKPSHTLFWIPLRFWIPIVAVSGVAMVVSDLYKTMHQ